MRRIAARHALAALAAAGCASMGSPPGGPQRTTPPEIVSVTPDSGAVNVRARTVEFTFDEVVDDRGGSSGDLASLFLVSPREGAPKVSWHRKRIEVEPRNGFQPNTAYSVTLLPGLADLRRNVMKTGRTVVFSTGPVIPPFTVYGRVFDWASERAAANALVEVIRQPDSLPYVGAADSTGQFAVGPLAEGTYLVRAIIDANRNRAVDPTEPWDSVTVTVRTASPFLELLAIARDTIPPRLLTVTTRDTVTILASFDRPLSPAAPLTAASFRVVSADSVPLRIARVTSLAALDSMKRALDTTKRIAAPRADSARAPTAPVVAPPHPSRPPPLRDVVVVLDSATPLHVGASYRVTAIDVRGLVGPARSSDRLLTVPAPTPADSTRAPAASQPRPPAPPAPPAFPR